jgi:hypothetical protein
MNILPGETPCLRRSLRFDARAGIGRDLRHGGIPAPAAAMVAAVEAAEAIKILPARSPRRAASPRRSISGATACNG